MPLQTETQLEPRRFDRDPSLLGIELGLWDWVQEESVVSWKDTRPSEIVGDLHHSVCSEVRQHEVLVTPSFGHSSVVTEGLADLCAGHVDRVPSQG